MSVNQHEFAALDYAGFTDPVLLAGHRTRARTAARARAVKRLTANHRAEFDAIFAEEIAAMNLEFQRRLEATRRKAERERGPA